MPRRIGAVDLHSKAHLSLPGERQGEARTRKELESGYGKLTDRYGFPPFSLLDTRQKAWQARKRAYLSLGIQSELGRDGGLSIADPNLSAGTMEPYREINGKASNGKGRLGKTYNSGGPGTLGQSLKATNRPGSKNDYRPGRAGGQYSGGDAYLTSSRRVIPGGAGQNAFMAHWKGRGDNGLLYTDDGWVDSAIGLAGQTGTSVFDPVVCEIVYNWFCPPGGVVVDPFAGGSVRGIVAALWGRGYIGIDLRPEQVAANEAQLFIVPGARIKWITGDARDIDTHLGNYKGDVLFTCPPYFNLEQYSYDDRDLSNIGDYSDFLQSYATVIRASLNHLKQNRFAAIMVGNVRDKQGYMLDLVGDTITLFERAGAHFYNDIILMNSVGSLPVRVANQMKATRKIGKNHQNLLIFVKGDPRLAAKACLA